MLSVQLNKKKNQIHFLFETPIPGYLKEHREIDYIGNSLENESNSDWIIENGQITGIAVSVDKLRKFVTATLPNNEVESQVDFIEKGLMNSEEQGEGLIINFHQKSYDTPERYWNFILNQGNFRDYFYNRLNWFLGPKRSITTKFPLHVDIETANTCNMDCPMCYRRGLSEIGQMDMSLFKRVIDECAENNVFSVRLSWRGEALTHPKIKDMIRYSTQKIKNVSFLTNAFYINEEMANCFVDHKVSYIAVSFDGIDDTYEAVRHPAKFKENYDRLKKLKEIREKKGSKLPQVRLCTIWPAISKNPDKYYETMKEVSDYIVCNPYINFMGPMKIKHDFICQYPWERIVIAFNGNTQCCTGWNADDIILGNVNNKNIVDMWHSELMRKIRKIHSNGQRMELSSCANCRHGSKGDPDIRIEDILERRY